MELREHQFLGPGELTPWEERNGRWYKMESDHRYPNGVNGAKARAALHMMENAAMVGYEHVVSAQSVLSPQSPICATLASRLGMKCTLVVGASKPETAIKHDNIRIAVEAGATLDTTCRVAYNGVIQPYAARLAEELGAWQLPYAISMPDDASPAALEAFLAVGGAQTEEFPDAVRNLVIPFGSGNTTAGVLYGLSSRKTNLEQIVLVGVGPDRTEWLWNRLGAVGVSSSDLPEIRHIPLHGWFADYGDKMKETRDGIVFHPTYEGKVVRALDVLSPKFWTDRDGATGMWIVGGGFK